MFLFVLLSFFLVASSFVTFSLPSLSNLHALSISPLSTLPHPIPTKFLIPSLPTSSSHHTKSPSSLLHPYRPWRAELRKSTPLAASTDTAAGETTTPPQSNLPEISTTPIKHMWSVWCGVVWCDVVWRSVVWCGVV